MCETYFQTYYHVWITPEGKRVIDEYETQAQALQQHRDAYREGLASYITLHKPSN